MSIIPEQGTGLSQFLSFMLRPEYENNLSILIAWRSGSGMDCHATARGSIPGGNGVFTELHVLC